jgi:ubiquinol oxidase
MEDLGGNEHWFDRFVAQHIALGYFWLALAFYLFNPTYAYHFNEMVEEEAFETYDRFVTEHAAYLKTQPATPTAQEYYRDGDLYMFDRINFAGSASPRRPQMKTLYDTFCAIREDEKEHVKTMKFMQQE